MKKTCVFITGTNAVGKSTLAKGVINLYGGVSHYKGDVTYCKINGVCFAGKYADNSKYGGVDSLNCTRTLADIVKRGLEVEDVIVCEGSFMNTFGMNLTNAMFQAERYLVVSLYASGEKIIERLVSRNGDAGRIKQIKFDIVLNKQKLAMVSAKKWQQIGVPVLQIDAGKYGKKEILDMTIRKIREVAQS